MAAFYGSIQGQRGKATRLGTKSSGITTYAASWQGAVRVDLSMRGEVAWAEVSLVSHHGAGTRRLLYSGPVGEYAPACLDREGPSHAA